MSCDAVPYYAHSVRTHVIYLAIGVVSLGKSAPLVFFPICDAVVSRRRCVTAGESIIGGVIAFLCVVVVLLTRRTGWGTLATSTCAYLLLLSADRSKWHLSQSLLRMRKPGFRAMTVIEPCRAESSIGRSLFGDCRLHQILQI
ncbi:hypothetical protein F5Y06DRAFT_266503 [Hypoxylon sp. FL0890]|nr:hypothetical protein F5Y06DRAFT_266503 [Hypoxylon sp. FL0890]